MLYEDPRDVKRDEDKDRQTAQDRERTIGDQNTEDQKDKPFTYTDWASI